MRKIRAGVLAVTSALLTAVPAPAGAATPSVPVEASCTTVTSCADVSWGCWYWYFGVCRGAHVQGSHSGLVVTGFLSANGQTNTCTGATSCNTYLSISGANLCGTPIVATTSAASGPATDAGVITC